MENKKFIDVYSVDVSSKTKAKGKLTYLSWAAAWAEFKKIYPTATYTIKKFENNLPYVHDEKTGYMVFTEVEVDGLKHEMWLPVMNNTNKTLLNAQMTDINKAIMRCLTKNLAMFGLGLYIYEGEDLPEAEAEPLDGKLLEELQELGGSVELVAGHFKIDVESVTNEQIQTLIDRKKAAMALAQEGGQQ